MNAAMWENRSFDNQIFVRGRFSYINDIITTSFMQTPIPIFRLENVLPTYFDIEIA
jgi:hypothetical protein